MTTFKFKNQTVNDVLMSDFTWENWGAFEKCDTDSDYCLTFVNLAYNKNVEIDLVKEITSEMIVQIAQMR